MKKILSLLMCYVFLQAETFALRGGPGGSGNRLSGSYSGVMTETSGGSDLALFVLNIAGAGASSGSVIVFEQSAAGARFYSGTITGLTNPTSGDFIGLFNSTATVTTTVGNIAVTSALSLAGTLKLSISPVVVRGSRQQVTGTAVGQANNGALKKFSVAGWQSSTEATSNGFATVSTNGS